MTPFILLRSILAAGLDELEAMNLLQQNHIIADNCVNLSDIAPADLARAVEFINNR